MQRSPLPSPLADEDSDPSRHGDTDMSSQANHVQFRRQSESSPPRPPQQDGSREWGGIKTSLDGREDVLDEQSPLLPPNLLSEDVGHVPPLSTVTSPEESSQGEAWNPDAGKQEESKSSWYLFLLTISIGGLQLAWSVELSNGSPYLLSLGITKSLLAIVWIAGPLSGVLVQPYVGIKSDRCRSRFGKRRPFMIGGAAATIVSLMILAWTREMVAGFLSIFGVDGESQATKTSALILAVIMVYILDFSINVIQAGIRAFIVDNAPTHQQDAANAWASRVSGMGNIVGYLFGYANLPKYMWFFGDTQFKVLCVIASLGLTITLILTCSYISERDPRREGVPAKEDSGVLAFFKSLFHSIRKLPSQIKAVCVVQLAAWMGWFPFLFYITTYIGELYVEPIFRENPHMTDKEIDEVWEHGTRVGTFALLIFAIVSFSSSVVLPWFIAKTYAPPAPASRTPMLTPGTPTASSNLSGYFTSRARASSDPAAGDLSESQSSLKSAFRNLPLLSNKSSRKINLRIPWLTLKRSWLLSHLLFALLTWLTLVVKTTTSATILAALIGIPWSITMWAPFALIAAEVSKRENIRRGFLRPPPTRDGEMLARGEDVCQGADQAGVVLGIHNVAVAAPQVIATVVSSGIFWALQGKRGSGEGDDSVGWVLRFGGLAALGAAWLTRRVREEGEEEGVEGKF